MNAKSFDLDSATHLELGHTPDSPHALYKEICGYSQMNIKSGILQTKACSASYFQEMATISKDLHTKTSGLKSSKS